MNKIARVDYDKMKFEFIYDHWDIHLNGLCWYEGKLCWFETFDTREYECNPLYYIWWTSPEGEKIQWEEYREVGELYCEIYEMTFTEKFKKQWKRFWFEFCVGHHWSYPNRNTLNSLYRYRDWKPRWLRKILYMLYYRRWKWPRILAGDSL